MTDRATTRRWLVALTALVVLAAAALVWVLLDARDVTGTDVSSADSADAVVASAAAKQAARERAGAGAAAAYSYSWKTLADDKAAARELMTPARVLVFVNQRTAGDDLDRPTLDLDRVLVTVRRVDGEWKVSELDSL